MASLGSHCCESCGKEVRFRLIRKTCSECLGSFCHRCVHPGLGGDMVCRKCEIFVSDLMERNQLETLSPSELRYYFILHNLGISSSNDKSLLIENILIHQAERLTQNALKAQRMLRDPTNLLHLDFISDKSSQMGLESHAQQLQQPSKEKHPSVLLDEVRKNFDPTDVNNLSDLQSVIEIDVLPVRQLKIILRRNCIDYKGCIEKDELKDRVKRLWKAREKEKEIEDTIANKGDLDAETDFLCKICMDQPVNCVILECGHMLTCVSCGRQLNECPMCRQFVTRVVHAFRV